jgi:hypothetical protein
MLIYPSANDLQLPEATLRKFVAIFENWQEINSKEIVISIAWTVEKISKKHKPYPEVKKRKGDQHLPNQHQCQQVELDDFSLNNYS